MASIMVAENKGYLRRKILAWIDIIRVGNCIALGYATIVGYILGGSKVFDQAMLFKLFIAAFVIGGSSNIINDYFDASIDAINKPWRPIPMGLIKANEAYFVSLIMGFIGIILSFTITYMNGIVALIAFALAYLYSFKLKKVLLVGNLIVAFSAALSIIYGGFASTNIVIDTVLATLFAFLLNFGRELLKGIEDVEGDKKYYIRTLAAVKGIKVAYVSSLIVFIILMLLSIIPYVFIGYSMYYLIMTLCGVDLVIIVALTIASSLQPKDALRSTRMLKVAVFVGITAFFVEGLKKYFIV
ncbi:MAG: geranylgeranylglycerol-phosphate geranylgeranyltransferase [Ignisphaera sp.]|uniref:Geranylgeranylglycerol-phosphate geranylgeranyltransferase n=1 Tax=Ignisphaera aggregans TaxID=334771 RepID=A0A832CS46_9CREN